MFLNLGKFKKLRTTQSHTELLHPAGHLFKIAHAALSPQNLRALKALPTHESPLSAEKIEKPKTEEVKRQFTDGGDVQQAPPLDHDEVKKFEQGFSGKYSGGPVGYADGTPDAPVGEEDGTADSSSDQPEPGVAYKLGQVIRDAVVNNPVSKELSGKGEGASPPYNPDSPLGQLVAGATGTSSPNGETTPPAEDAQSASTPAESPSAAPAPAAQATPSSPQFGLATLQGDLAQEEKGQRQEASAQQQEAQANIGTQQQLQGSLSKLASDYSTNVQKLQQQAADMSTALANGHIDPNHYLNNMGTGQRIASALGMIIGGAGAGLSHQQNLAAAFIDKQIDNDIGAQMANLNTKKSLLGFNLQRTQNLNASTALTKAMIYDMTASQLEQNKNQAIAGLPGKPGLAEANYNKAVGDLNIKAFQHLQQAAIFQTLQQHQQPGAQAQPGVDKQRFNLMEHSGFIPKEDVEAANKESQKYDENEALRGEWQSQFNHLNSQPLAGLLHPGDRASAINDIAGRIQHISEGRFNENQAKALAKTYLPAPFNFPSTVNNKRTRAQAFFDTQGQTPTLDRYELVNKTNNNPVVQHANGGRYQLGSDGQYHRVK